MGYRVIQSQIAQGNSMYKYCDSDAKLAKLLYNAALFRIRQIFTGYGKETLTDNEKQVFDEVAVLQNTYPSIKVRRVISYAHLEKMLRVTNNPDFFAGLPMQTSQHIVKQAVSDFKNWLAALRDYKQAPSKYPGKPQMPHYKKKDVTTFTVSNQDAVLYFTGKGMVLKLPCLKERLYYPNIGFGAVLKEVKIKPFYDRYILSLTLEELDAPVNTDMPYVCAVDFGTENLAAIVCNDGSSRLYKGGAVLSNCQWYSKRRAEAVSIITKGHKQKTASSRYLNVLNRYHYNFIQDQCHKISRSIIDFCLKHQAGTIVLGDNRLWKQDSGMGTKNNQNFVLMPIAKLRDMIVYKAANAGISVISQEESYTSKADITAMDKIPVYGVNDDEAAFSGSRIKRGLYRCANGLIINADCNGAANIMRKAIPEVWNGFKDFAFLSSPDVLGFHELNPQSNPVKRIAAA